MAGRTLLSPYLLGVRLHRLQAPPPTVQLKQFPILRLFNASTQQRKSLKGGFWLLANNKSHERSKVLGKGKKQLCSMRALPAWRLWACIMSCHGNDLRPCNTQTEKENRLRLESRSEKKTMQKRRVMLKKKKRREKTGIARVPLYQEWGSNPCVHTHIGT